MGASCSLLYVVSRGGLGQKHAREGAAGVKAYRRKSQEARQLEGSGRGGQGVLGNRSRRAWPLGSL